jgi:hypothetical protein
MAGGTGDQPEGELIFPGLPDRTGNARFSPASVIAPGVPLIFVSGLWGETATTPREEVQEIFARLGMILFETGSSFRHLAKSVGYYQNADGQKALGEIRGVFYDPARAPASSILQTAGVGRPGRTIVFDNIAIPATPGSGGKSP